MAGFVQVPPAQLSEEVYTGLLEEYVSRDGTDYGEVELTLWQKVENLRTQVNAGELAIVYDLASEQWDILVADDLKELDL